MKRVNEIKYAAVVFALMAAAMVTGCGKSSVGSPTSPSSPSPSGSNPPAGGSAVISGSVSVASFSAAGLKVAVSGYGVSSTVAANGSFQLQQVPAGNLSLQFSGPSVNAVVPIGQVAERERVEVQIQLNGGSGDVESSEHVSPDDHSEIEGRIASIDASSRSLQVGSRSVQVPANARISSGANSFDFSALKLQQHVHVSGSVQGNAVLADHIEIEDGVEAEPEPESEFSGSISALGGSCPALSLSIGGKSVLTNNGTQFVNAACGDIASGMNVEVKGNVQGNGSILASRIQVDDNGQPEPETEFSGSVASLSGSCPQLALSVASKSVSTSSATLFDGISCSAVQPGSAIEVKGNVKADGSVAASRIRPQ